MLALSQMPKAEIYLRASQQISELKSLNKISVPDHASVLDANIVECVINLVNLPYTLVERFLRSEDGRIGLHDLLHGASDLTRALWTS